ncbi:hypothetical protein CEK26_009856 [Fusarium fujikuroi]|uniref:Uncharacterized protein n=1 Tax=Fusarium fujikuroi TaxID=5127 RepID=A0A5Q3DGF2_FUSFU|nr:hypothetical protein CEK27_009876 [Fusarium fujikuroi]QGI83145.1 hypothetical protein CEK25_009874 [Fusarium fujikuroi]QGI96787.1 hypothetical protein CEK26_009856 [Fusarium fujikuroi]VTT59704.1 unnamed protein product [Fusarium fujikuroi]VZI06110.1 unnamed protein product [Fusarium fujikuroi]
MEGIGSVVEQHSRWGRNSSRNREPVGKGQSRCRRRETRRRVTEEMALDESRFKVASRWFENAPGDETIMVVSGERKSYRRIEAKARSMRHQLFVEEEGVVRRLISQLLLLSLNLIISLWPPYLIVKIIKAKRRVKKKKTDPLKKGIVKEKSCEKRAIPQWNTQTGARERHRDNTNTHSTDPVITGEQAPSRYLASCCRIVVIPTWDHPAHFHKRHSRIRFTHTERNTNRDDRESEMKGQRSGPSHRVQATFFDFLSSLTVSQCLSLSLNTNTKTNTRRDPSFNALHTFINLYFLSFCREQFNLTPSVRSPSANLSLNHITFCEFSLRFLTLIQNSLGTVGASNRVTSICDASTVIVSASYDNSQGALEVDLCRLHLSRRGVSPFKIWIRSIPCPGVKESISRCVTVAFGQQDGIY